MAARITLLILSASSTTALQVPARRAGVAPKTLRFVEVAERMQTSEDKAETFSAGDYLNTLDRFGPDSAEPSNNIIASPFDAEPNAFDAMIDEAAEEAAKVLDGVVEEVVQQVAEDRKDEAAADAVAAVEKTISRASSTTTMEKIETAAVPMEEIEVGPVGEFLIKWGFKDDPRIPRTSASQQCSVSRTAARPE